MLRPVVLALTFVTGFTGLAYEVTWQKYLAILLGAHSEATASVLGLFLGGLSLGYWLFGALTRRLVARGERSGRPAPLLLVYGGVEAGIGLYCLLFPQLFPAVRRLSTLLPTGDGALGFLADLALAALLILPPAILMGGTIPILTQALARSLRDATRLHAFVYAFNTAGAFAGALASGFVLIEWLGLPGVMVAMGVVNLGVGGVLALLGLRRRAIATLDPGESPPSSAAWTVYAIAALLIGFAMMVLQTTVIRLGGLAFGSSEYTFAMVVAAFVLCIALGSAAVSLLPRLSRHLLPLALWALAVLFAGLYFALETSPYWAHVLRTQFRDHPASFYPYYAAVFALVLFAIGPAVILSGAMLPLLFHALKREVGDLGARAGRLYSLNTLGSLAGALLGGYALLLWLDLHHVYRIAVAALALAAAIVTSAQYPRLHFAGIAALLLAAIGALASFPAWSPGYLTSGAFRAREPADWTYAGPSQMPQLVSRYIFYDDDPNSSVAVQEIGFEGDPDFSRTIRVNGKSDGNSLGDYNTMAMAALLPALLTERVEDAFVIGLGTGVTAGELASLEEVKSVTVAEISAGVIEAAPYFDFANHGASKHPKIRIVRSDAYRALLESGQEYDVIVSEPSNPWVTGVEMLFAREFLEEARRRLSPGGVYCQWFHLYETSDEVVALVLRTFASVFDHAAVWAPARQDLLLLGFRDPAPALDLPRLERRMAQADFKAGFARMRLGGPAPLLAHEILPLDVLNAAQLDGAIHSLYRPRLSYEAGRGFFVGGQGQLPFLGYGEPARVGRDHSLLRRRLARFDGGPVPDQVAGRIAGQVCASGLSSCETLLAQWMRTRSEAMPEWLSGLPNGAIRWALARDLLPLFEPPGLAGAASPPLPPMDALRATQQFMTRYAFAAPFDPEALVSLWERCGVDAGTRRLCQRGLKNARELREGIRPPDPIHWLPLGGAAEAELAAERAERAPRTDP